MISMEFSESISETLDILNHMDKVYMDEIPKKFIDFLENNKSNTYETNLNHSQKISEMKLKEKTKDILAIIYMKYWCSPEEKKDILDLFNENEKKYQEELREKYNPDDIFNKNEAQRITEEKHSVEKVNIAEYKESFFKRVIKKIKSFFS